MSRELTELCKGKLGIPYVFGMKGQILTGALLQQLATKNPKVYTSQYITRARNFMGEYYTDCSDLIAWHTGALRGSADHREIAWEVKPIGTLDKSVIGQALWEPGHIGVYIGNGKCIEAKGVSYGVVETRAQGTPWASVLKLEDIDYPAQVCESPDPSPHPTGWIEEDRGVHFYLEPERYTFNDWYQDKGQWFWFDNSGHAVRDNQYFCKDNWYYFGPDFIMVRGVQPIRGKPYYFNRDGQMVRFSTRFMVRVDGNGVLRFPGEGSVENSVTAGRIWGRNEAGMELEDITPGNIGGKTPVLAAYEDSEYTGGVVLPPDTKTGTTQVVDSKVEQSGREGTGGTYQTVGDRTAVISILTGDRRTATRVAAERRQ